MQTGVGPLEYPGREPSTHCRHQRAWPANRGAAWRGTACPLWSAILREYGVGAGYGSIPTTGTRALGQILKRAACHGHDGVGPGPSLTLLSRHWASHSSYATAAYLRPAGGTGRAGGRCAGKRGVERQKPCRRGSCAGCETRLRHVSWQAQQPLRSGPIPRDSLRTASYGAPPFCAAAAPRDVLRGPSQCHRVQPLVHRLRWRHHGFGRLCERRLPDHQHRTARWRRGGR